MRHTPGPYQALPEEPPPVGLYRGKRTAARPPVADLRREENKIRTETKGCDTPGSRMGETCGKASDA